MKNLIFSVLLAAVLVSPAFGETKEGACQLKAGKPFGEGAFTVQVGETVKGTCRFYIDDFFGKKIASSAESVGLRGFWEVSESVIENGF